MDRQGRNVAVPWPKTGRQKITTRGATLIAPIVCSIMLAHFGGAGCLPKAPESVTLVTAAHKDVYSHLNQLEEQKPRNPGPLAPLKINVDAVESRTTMIGGGGGGGGGG